jgi:hypothetical protein
MAIFQEQQAGTPGLAIKPCEAARTPHMSSILSSGPRYRNQVVVLAVPATRAESIWRPKTPRTSVATSRSLMSAPFQCLLDPIDFGCVLPDERGLIA